ncbi:MAG: hypothetical protein WD231_05165 [Candidatus Woykebacteria bacterium]
MQDVPEDPGSLGIPPEEMMTERGKEEIGEKFKAQLPKFKERRYNLDWDLFKSETYKEVDLDEKRLFVNYRHDTPHSTSYERIYFAYDFQADSFEPTSEADVAMGGVRFYKARRIAGQYSREHESLYVDHSDSDYSIVDPNTTVPHILYELNIFSGEKRRDALGEDNTNQETEPELSNSTYICPMYDNNELTGIDFKGPLTEMGGRSRPNFETTQEIEGLAQRASVKEGVEFKDHKGQIWARVSYNSTDRNFEFEFRDSQQQPAYLIHVPRRIGAKFVSDETRAKVLLDHPELPPEVDEYWKRADFSALLGIKIEPVVG